MRTLDRFLRIIYKEISLSELINKESDTSNHASFQLDNKEFRNLIIRTYLSVYPNNYTYDELECFIDDICLKIKQYNPDNSPNSINLFLYIAKQMLFFRSGKIMVSFDNLLQWNGFINKVDSNILIAAKLALDGHQIFNEQRVEHDNNRLLSLLSSGISENHMHFKGSGYTTDMNWFEFSNSSSVKLSKFKEIIRKQNPANETEEIISFYKMRYIKMFLFSRFINGDRSACKSDSKDADLPKNSHDKHFDIDFIKCLLSHTNQEKYELLFLSKKELLKYWQDLFRQRYCNHFETRKYFLSERMFLKDLFKAMLCGKMDSLTLYLFNVYVLASSKFKMLFYQSNIGMGFQKFKDAEDIKETLLDNYSNIDIFKTVFDKYYAEKNVRKIEFRIAPKRTTEEYLKLIKNAKKAEEIIARKTNTQRIKYGFIVHYIKNKEEFNYRDGLSRKEKFYDDLKNKSAALIAFFNQYNPEREAWDTKSGRDFQGKIKGIDAANYELNCRPEYFGYSFRRQKCEISCSHDLKFTFHVGEEFITLANGLRAIDEVIEFLNFERGDRLGHALALGIDVDKYFATKRNILVSNIEEYIDDIVWMKYFIEKTDSSELIEILNNKIGISEILEFLNNEFYRYFKNYCYHSNYDIYDYYCGYKLRGDLPEVYTEIDEIYKNQVADGTYDLDRFYTFVTSKYGIKLNSCNSEHRSAFLNRKGRELFHQYHYSSSFKEMHKKTLNIDVDKCYIEAVRIVQYALRKKIYNSEISIESNPSSNIKVSSVFKFIDLPFFQINQMYKDVKGKYDLVTSINTDDSAIFQTDLSLEYAYVVAALQQEGYDLERIYEYIEYMRKSSMIQSFVNDFDE